mmetsp:Transcript_497/g.907  ORF Transcript_497/g.907 Transcript_497/m.907 type:complete len:86 (-) Transcript_497:17-274(-)
MHALRAQSAIAISFGWITFCTFVRMVRASNFVDYVAAHFVITIDGRASVPDYCDKVHFTNASNAPDLCRMREVRELDKLFGSKVT